MKYHFRTSKICKKDGVHTIIDDLNETKFALETAYSCFDNVTDPDLIDCYIYEMNSILKRYRYLLSMIPNTKEPTTSFVSQAKNPLLDEKLEELIPNP